MILRHLLPLLAALTASCAAAPDGAVLVSASPVEEPPKSAVFPPSITINYERLKLSNGMHVILHEDHEHPVVATALVVNCGSTADPPGKAGLAHLVEHLMFASPKAGSRKDYSTLLDESSGWGVNGHTLRDWTMYVASVPRASLTRLLWAEADRLTHHNEDVDDARVTHERLITDEERAMHTEGARLGRVPQFIADALWTPDHPYRRASHGDAREIASITRADADTFFRDHYGAANLTLVIAGDFESSKVKQLVARDFSALPSGTPQAPPRPMPSALANEKKLFVAAGIARDEVMITWPLPPAKEVDFAAIGVAASYLRRVDRWPGIDADSFTTSAGLYASSMTLSLVLGPNTTPQAAIDHFDRTVATVTDHSLVLDRDRLNMARASELGTLIYSLDSFSGRANWMGAFAVSRDDPGYVATLFARDSALTADDVRQTMEALFASRRRVVCYVSADRRAPLAGELRDAPPSREEKR